MNIPIKIEPGWFGAPSDRNRIMIAISAISSHEASAPSMKINSIEISMIR